MRTQGELRRLLFLAPGDVRKGRVEPISYMRTCDAFARRGLDVHLVTPRIRRVDAIPKETVWAHYGLEESFSIHELPTPLKATSRTWLFRVAAAAVFGIAAIVAALESLIRRGGQTVVYGRLPILLIPFLVTSRVFRRRWRFVYETHTLPPAHARGLLGRVDLIIVTSQRLRADLIGTYGVPQKRILVAPLGPYNDVTEHPRDEARRALGLPMDAFIVCYSGKMTKEQNEVFICVAELLQVASADYRLLLVGGNPSILEWTRARVAERNLGNVVLTPGFVEPTKVDLYQSAAEILLLYMSPTMEHWPYATPAKAFEYMSMGRLIVSNVFPLFKEVFGGDAERAIAAGHTPDSLVASIERARHLPDRGTEIITRAKEFVAPRSWDQRTGEVLASLGIVGWAKA